MHGNQWVLKIAVLKYYSVSKRGTTAKSNPKQATDPISLHTKFGDNSSNTFPLNERKPCVTPDIGRQTLDGRKSKNNISTPRGVDKIIVNHSSVILLHFKKYQNIPLYDPRNYSKNATSMPEYWLHCHRILNNICIFSTHIGLPH